MRINSSLLAITLLFAASCSFQPKFEVSGKISDAADKTIYLEEIGKPLGMALDSAKLGKDGKYSFSLPAVSYPSFYAIRLGNDRITFSVDSTESVKINSSASAFGSKYDVEGSHESKKIQEVVLRGQELNKEIRSLNQALNDKTLSQQEFRDSVLSLIDIYKADVQHFIYENPRSASAFFTLYQRIGGYSIFDANNPKDYRAYGAVATSWDSFYPESASSKYLKELTLEAFKARRKANSNDKTFDNIEEIDNFEIELPNRNGKLMSLSSLKGKVVLLDFTAYQGEHSGPYNIALAELYSKYKDRGFEIYQISLDADEHFWKVTSSNLPWITVRDRNSQYSSIAKTYNVTSLPTAYILDREGAIRERATGIEQLEKQIKELLK